MADDEMSLYDRLGGEDGILSLVGEFYGRILEDDELKPFFEGVPMERLQRMQLELFSEALGGPVTYSGRPLREVHHGRGIKMSHFQRFVEHLISTLKDNGLEESEVDQLISRLNVEADKIVGQSNVDG